MKANELMIGNWVMIENYSRICAIAEDGVYFTDKEGRGATSFDRIEPIPLTAEILEKNGFKEKDVFYLLDFFDYGLYISEITESIWKVQFYNHECSAFDSIICVGYVHELQHALRLCGIDKEIVL